MMWPCFERGHIKYKDFSGPIPSISRTQDSIIYPNNLWMCWWIQQFEIIRVVRSIAYTPPPLQNFNFIIFPYNSPSCQAFSWEPQTPAPRLATWGVKKTRRRLAPGPVGVPCISPGPASPDYLALQRWPVFAPERNRVVVWGEHRDRQTNQRQDPE